MRMTRHPFTFRRPSTPDSRGPRVRQAVWAVIVLSPWLGANAQDAENTGGKPAVTITPRVSVTETFTSNALLQSRNARSEWITQVSPGIRLASQGGRLRGSLDYSLNEFAYARGTQGRQRQNALNASGVAELVDAALFLDVSGQVSQQSVSALATPTNVAGGANGNSTETSTFRLSPYWRGVLGGVVEYEARYGWTDTQADSANASDVRTREWSLKLAGVVSGPMSWSADVASKRLSYSLGRPLADDRIQGAVSYAYSPQLSFTALASRYADNYATVALDRQFSVGLGFNWALSPVTKMGGQLERRTFGNSHNLSFEHRTARTAWRFSDSRSVTAAPAQSGTTVVGSLSDLLFAQFAGTEPDPLKRAALVDQFMLTNGLSSDAKVISNFLSSSATLQRRQEASFVLLGVRDTVTFVLSRSASSKLDTVVLAFDDFTNNNIVRQTGFTSSYAHRLTPDWAVNLGASLQRSSGSAAASSTTLRSLDLSLVGRLGRQLNGSIGARRVWFDHSTNPYSETAVIGGLSVQF